VAVSREKSKISRQYRREIFEECGNFAAEFDNGKIL
jgi:hypothetical protein